MSTPRELECILLSDHDAVYVEVPKVACTSIKTALASLVGVVRDPWDRLVSRYRDNFRSEAPPYPTSGGVRRAPRRVAHIHAIAIGDTDLSLAAQPGGRLRRRQEQPGLARRRQHARTYRMPFTWWEVYAAD